MGNTGKPNDKAMNNPWLSCKRRSLRNQNMLIGFNNDQIGEDKDLYTQLREGMNSFGT